MGNACSQYCCNKSSSDQHSQQIMMSALKEEEISCGDSKFEQQTSSLKNSHLQSSKLKNKDEKSFIKQSKQNDSELRSQQEGSLIIRTSQYKSVIMQEMQDQNQKSTIIQQKSELKMQQENEKSIIIPSESKLRNEASQNCEIISNFTDFSEGKYRGSYYNFNNIPIPHGEGSYKYNDLEHIVHGKFEHGKLINIIKLVYLDASYYEGETDLRLAHGKGLHQAKDKSWIYNGQFVCGKRDGQGRLELSGTIYEGEFKQGYLTNGKITYSDNSIYKGQVNKFSKHGEGILFRPDGTVSQKGQFLYDFYKGP